jgi:hypothetical protein
VQVLRRAVSNVRAAGLGQSSHLTSGQRRNSYRRSEGARLLRHVLEMIGGIGDLDRTITAIEVLAEMEKAGDVEGMLKIMEKMGIN